MKNVKKIAMAAMSVFSEPGFQKQLANDLLEKYPTVLCIADVIKLFNVDRTTVYRWREKKFLPYCIMGGKVVFPKITLSIVLVALMAQNGNWNNRPKNTNT